MIGELVRWYKARRREWMVQEFQENMEGVADILTGWIKQDKVWKVLVYLAGQRKKIETRKEYGKLDKELRGIMVRELDRVQKATTDEAVLGELCALKKLLEDMYGT